MIDQLRKLWSRILGMDSSTSGTPDSAAENETVSIAVDPLLKGERPDSQLNSEAERIGFIDITDHPVEFAFGHGRLHGQWRLEGDQYLDYLRLKSNENSLLQEDARCQAELEKEQASRLEVARLQGRSQSLGLEIQAAEQDLESAERERIEIKKQIADSRDKMEALKSRGSWTYLTIYGLAGLVFIVGDVALARFTVAKALRIDRWEGWAFAIGLALLAIVIKPVYDRLIEDRYHEGFRKAFTYFIVGSALFAATFLVIMGGYRADFMQSNAAHEQLSRQQTTLTSRLQQARQVDNEAEVQRLSIQIEQLGGQLRENEQALLHNKLGRWALLLSQVLFAIAGAICLGIATRNLLDWWHLRRPLFKRLGKVQHENVHDKAGSLYKALHETNAAIVATRQRLTLLQKEYKEVEAEIGMLEPDEKALERIAALRARRDEIQKDLRELRADLHGPLYQTGRKLGLRLPSPVYGSSGDGYSSNGTINVSPDMTRSASERRKRRRLYLAIRDAVRAAAVPPVAGNSQVA